MRPLDMIVAPLGTLLLAGLVVGATSAFPDPDAPDPGAQRRIQGRLFPLPPRRCPHAAWVAASPIPFAAYRYGFAQNGDDLYVIAVGSLHKYDAAADNWVTLAPVPRALQVPGVVFYGGKLYAAGGMDDGLSNDLFIYDIATNTWTAGAGLPIWSYGSAAGVYGGKMFVVSGTLGQYLLVYDIATNTWSVGPSPPVAYRMGGHTQVGQYLYLIGSLGSSGNTVSRRLDMASITWSTGPVWTPARGDFALASDGNKLYAMGGRVWNESTLSAEVYELALAEWLGGQWTRRLPDLPSPREANQAGFTTTGRIWSTGGYGPGPTYLFEHLSLSLTPCDAGPSPPPRTFEGELFTAMSPRSGHSGQ